MFHAKRLREWGSPTFMEKDKAFIEFILKNGKHYIPAKLPEEVRRGPVGKCFDVTIVNALHSPHLRYVEGIARDPRTEDRWVLHAWLTDANPLKGMAYDPTWGHDSPIGILPLLTDYIGIAIDSDLISRFMLSTEYVSVFSNGWRDPVRARECFPLIPPSMVPVEQISNEFFMKELS